MPFAPGPYLKGDLRAADQVLAAQEHAADLEDDVGAGDREGELGLRVVVAGHRGGADRDVRAIGEAHREREAAADGGLRVVVEVVALAGARERVVEVVAFGGALRAADRVDGVVELVRAEEVYAVELDAVVDPRRGEDALVPVGVVEHAAHVVGQRLVARAVVRGVVTEREAAEGGREATDAHVEGIGGAEIEVGHAELGAVASDAHLHVRAHAVGEIDGELERDLDGRAVERACARDLLGRHREVVELDRAREVACRGLVGAARLVVYAWWRIARWWRWRWRR
jgi:hypothetical protein